jgi:hypothetical protein
MTDDRGGGDDRFEDLSVGDRLAERDRTHPEPVRRPEAPRPTNKYAWAVGIVMLMVLGIVLFAQTLPNQGSGLRGPEVGGPLPAFAAIEARSDKDGDANVCQKEPCNENAGPVPACEVEGSGIVVVCPKESGPRVLTFVVTRGTDCEPQVDRLERIAADYPGVKFVTVLSGDSKDEARNLARARRWRQPVAVDEDGSLVNLYGVGVCPVTVFARDGKVRSSPVGNLTEEDLRRRVERLSG